MTLEDPLFLHGSVQYDAREFRRLIDAIFTEGYLGAGAFAVTQRAAGANFSVDIAAGLAVIQGDDQSLQGKYLARSTATENRTVTAAPGSNSRLDIVVLRVNDPTAGGAAGNNVTIEVIAGTPAGSPSAPAVPASALLLATIGPITSATASITNAIITDARVRAKSVFDLFNDASVLTAYLADAAVTAAKLATNSVETAKIVDAAVTAAKLASNSVTTAKIADANVTEAKLAAAVLSSGWTLVPLASGWGDVIGQRPLLYKKIGNVGFVCGAAMRSSGSSQIVGTLPAGFRPFAPIRSVGWGGTAQEIELQVDGDINWGAASTGVPLYINMIFAIES